MKRLPLNMNENTTKGGNKMKRLQKSVLLCLLFVGLLGFAATQPVMAAGTVSGTVITNNATLIYEVDGAEIGRASCRERV